MAGTCCQEEREDENTDKSDQVELEGTLETVVKNAAGSAIVQVERRVESVEAKVNKWWRH